MTICKHYLETIRSAGDGTLAVDVKEGSCGLGLDKCTFLDDDEVFCWVKLLVHQGPTVYYGKITKITDNGSKFIIESKKSQR